MVLRKKDLLPQICEEIVVRLLIFDGDESRERKIEKESEKGADERF